MICAPSLPCLAHQQVVRLWIPLGQGCAAGAGAPVNIYLVFLCVSPPQAEGSLVWSSVTFGKAKS